MCDCCGLDQHIAQLCYDIRLVANERIGTFPLRSVLLGVTPLRRRPWGQYRAQVRGEGGFGHPFERELAALGNTRA